VKRPEDFTYNELTEMVWGQQTLMGLLLARLGGSVTITSEQLDAYLLGSPRLVEDVTMDRLILTVEYDDDTPISGEIVF